MNALLQYLEKGYSVTDIIATLIVIGALIVCVEAIVKKVTTWIKGLHSHIQKKENDASTLEQNTVNIRSLVQKIDGLSYELKQQYQVLNSKMDSIEAKGNKTVKNNL